MDSVVGEGGGFVGGDPSGSQPRGYYVGTYCEGKKIPLRPLPVVCTYAAGWIVTRDFRYLMPSLLPNLPGDEYLASTDKQRAATIAVQEARLEVRSGVPCAAASLSEIQAIFAFD